MLLDPAIHRLADRCGLRPLVGPPPEAGQPALHVAIRRLKERTPAVRSYGARCALAVAPADEDPAFVPGETGGL